MLSVSTVRSAKGASAYFAADNYYTAGEAEAAGEWFGKGAAALGLEGRVDKETFEALLKGSLPNGSHVGSPDRHRAGIDLTFSMPKSWSLLALVGGDRRIVEAYREAVKETLAWAESNAAETRMGVKDREKIVPTGNLVVALFEHDTSRAQEPQAHLHAVVANVTQGPDGKWRALHNDKLWSLNTLLNSMTMASFREKVEALGYAVGERGKHGNFEAAGIARNIVMAFSTRRKEILAKIAEMTARSPEAFAAATLMTRAKKMPAVDREQLYAGWRDSAASIGLDLPAMIAEAKERAAEQQSPWTRVAEAAGEVIERGRALVASLSERLGLAKGDPYLPRSLHTRQPKAITAAHAVASALRHLEQREAAFKLTDIYKAALDLGLPTEIAAIEARVKALVRAKQLVVGDGRGADMMTTAQAIETESRILAEFDAGRGAGTTYLDRKVAASLLGDAAFARSGIRLNSGQQTAGTLLLSSHDRIIAIQGVAGAGKSSMLGPAAELIARSGRPVLGLAVQNTLVQMLARETRIEAMTVARFLKTHAAILAPVPERAALAEARAALGGAAILVDEASMLSNADQLKLVTLANRLELGRMAFVGDARQLGAVDAGKPFSVMQQAGAPTAHMLQNLRARGDGVRVAAAAAQIGKVEQAMEALAPFTVEAPGRGAVEAAERWLALGADDRDRTAIYASGRRLRSEVNTAVQAGLVARGEVGPNKLNLSVLERVSLTDEELRYAHSYERGMIVEIEAAQPNQRLPRTRATVERVDAKLGLVALRLADDRERKLRPSRLKPDARESPLQLYQPKALEIYERDRIRWTANDHHRGLLNADRATVIGIDATGVTVETSLGQQLTLNRDDPMLKRLDLAYAVNAHMAQGLTSDAGIAVMETRDARLVNQQTFLVTVTRLRDSLTLIVDRASSIKRQLLRNAGGKSSALETTGELRRVAAEAASRRDLATNPLVGEPEKSIVLHPSRAKPFELGF